MWEGKLVSINVTDEAGAQMRSVEHVNAVAGKGLEGDRYFAGTGSYSQKQDGLRQVTFIEIEAVQALQSEVSISLEPGSTRRNLVTQGVPLNHLVGKTFIVGQVTFRGLLLCEPCQNLANMTEAGVLPALIHRGGLRAEILTSGAIQTGDPIRPT